MPEAQSTPYDGSLETLVQLVEEGKVDITSVALAETLEQEFARLSGSSDAGALAEFVSTGARLLYLKSSALISQPSRPEERSLRARPAYERPVHVPQHALVGEQAATLRRLEEEARRVYPRLARAYFQAPLAGLKGITLESLYNVFQEALDRQSEQPAAKRGPARPKPATIDQKIAAIASDLERYGELSFRSVMLDCQSREDVIVAFLAVLELIKSNRCTAEQDGPFGEIVLVAAA
jgi:segregation and condensation protein A